MRPGRPTGPRVDCVPASFQARSVHAYSPSAILPQNPFNQRNFRGIVHASAIVCTVLQTGRDIINCLLITVFSCNKGREPSEFHKPRVAGSIPAAAIRFICSQ
jgi:hypothetical protein